MSRPWRSTDAPVRTLPLRVPLGDGEALDSWLLRLAYRNGIPARWLLPVLGLDVLGLIRMWRNHGLAWRLPAGLLRRIETQTGLPRHTLDRAVLDRYEPLGWRPTVGSRYCAGCLTESGGAWPIRWQLPYTFACTRHRCLLAEACPACARTPHAAWSTESGLLPTHRCCVTSRRPHRGACGADLRTHHIQRLRAGDPRLAAQEWINQRLDVLDDVACTELRDLDTLATWFRQRLEPADVRSFGRSTMEALAEYRGHRHSTRRRQPATPTVTAAIATQAVGLLTAPDHRGRYQQLAPLFRDHSTKRRPGSAPPRAPMILPRKRMTRLSPRLRHRLLAACDPHLPISERLRYRTCTPTSQLPEPRSAVAAERARHIPRYLWTEWVIRFQPPAGAHAETIATDIPAALLLPGNPVRNANATGELKPWTHNTSQTLRLLADHHRDTLTAICALAHYLDTHGGPIDYRRRRATFPDVTLTRQQWHDLCYHADADPGKGARLRHARRYLFQLLTGNGLADPHHPLGFTDSSDRHNYLADFHRDLSTPLRDALHHHATQLLHGAGIDEPVTWSPPADCVGGLTLPGRDPDDIDVDAVHQLVDVDRISPTAAARQLGVSIGHVRHALHRLPLAPAPLAANSPTAARRLREHTSALLSRDFFEREYIRAGKNLATIESETGIRRDLLAERARHLGIRLAHDLPSTSIDPDWLREQAETLQRTNGDVAAELGLSHETIRRHRNRLGIAARPSGSAGHRVQIRRHPDLPADIRRAVEGKRHGWQRLRRFQQIAAHASINAAAHALGLHHQNLVLQLDRLEADIGATLINRTNHRYQPMTPTRRGRRLLNLLNQHEIEHLLNTYARGPADRPARVDR
jgi:molybdenum-dependent DNA-binding transcriptional regulator ModE